MDPATDATDQVELDKAFQDLTLCRTALEAYARRARLSGKLDEKSKGLGEVAALDDDIAQIGALLRENPSATRSLFLRAYRERLNAGLSSTDAARSGLVYLRLVRDAVVAHQRYSRVFERALVTPGLDEAWAEMVMLYSSP